MKIRTVLTEAAPQRETLTEITLKTELLHKEKAPQRGNSK
jgi:hypothetical protein